MPEFSRAVFRANFAEDRDIARREVVEGILDGMGLEGRRIVGEALAPSNKERLREFTETAWKIGIFGAPTFVIDREIFWGNDRMEAALEWHLGSGAER